MDQLEYLTSLSNELKLLKADEKHITQTLEDNKKRQIELSQDLIPTALQELGLNKIVLDSGETVSYKVEVRASIPKDRATDACEWLSCMGYGSVVKAAVSLNYDRGDRDTALEVYKSLANKGINASFNETVHPQTLKKLVKTLLEEGADIPDNLISVHVFNETVLK